MDGRKRRVVPGTRVYFKDDIRIDDGALRMDLPLPPNPALPFDELTILMGDRLLRLQECPPAQDSLTICGLTFAVTEYVPVRAVEEQYLRAGGVAQAQALYLRRLLPSLLDANGEPARNGFHHHFAALAIERLEESMRDAAVPMAQPKAPPLSGPRSHLAAVLPGYDRSLFLDGKRYDLLTVREFFERWRNGFHTDLAAQVLDEKKEWSARELSRFLAKRSRQANPRALSVVRSRLHTRQEPLHLRLGGRDFVPEYRGTAAPFAVDWMRVLATAVKLEALKRYLEG